MSVARFIADQRTIYAVPHTLVCALLGVSLAWFYKWIKRADGPGAASGLFTDTDRRRDAVDRAVKVDVYVPGCPPDADTILYVFSEILEGRIPTVPTDIMRYD